MGGKGKPENLIPFNKMDEETQRKIASMGGKAAAEKRKRNKRLRESMNELLAMKVSNRRDRSKLARMGIDDEDIDNGELLIVALFEKAVKCGDVKAFNAIMDLTGENTQADENGQLEQLIEGLKSNE